MRATRLVTAGKDHSRLQTETIAGDQARRFPVCRNRPEPQKSPGSTLPDNLNTDEVSTLGDLPNISH